MATVGAPSTITRVRMVEGPRVLCTNVLRGPILQLRQAALNRGAHLANTAKFRIWNTYLVSPVPLAGIPNNSRCPRTPACFFTCVRSAKFDFVHWLAIVACSARTVRYRVPQFRPDAPIAANRQQRTKASRSRSADNQQCSMNDSPAAPAAILLICATGLFHARTLGDTAELVHWYSRW